MVTAVARSSKMHQNDSWTKVPTDVYFQKIIKLDEVFSVAELWPRGLWIPKQKWQYKATINPTCGLKMSTTLEK